MTFPDDAIEFGRQWSAAAGELHGVKTTIAEIEKRAGEAFVRKQDAVANALRDLASYLTHQRDNLNARLDEFLTESRRRELEIRKMVR